MLKKFIPLVLVGALLAGVVCWRVLMDGDAVSAQRAAAAEAAQPAEETQAAEEEDYFLAFRKERAAVREQEMQYLDEIIATAAVDDETMAQAVERKLALVENMEAEFSVESLLAAKGFSDAAVTFHNGAVNVVVGAHTLTDEEAAQILDVVQRETGVRASEVKITTGGR